MVILASPHQYQVRLCVVRLLWRLNRACLALVRVQAVGDSADAHDHHPVDGFRSASPCRVDDHVLLSHSHTKITQTAGQSRQS